MHARNRHNVGIHFVDFLARRYQATFTETKAGSYFLVTLPDKKVTAVYRSPSYMNLSGIPFKLAIKNNGIQATQGSDIIIAHDDLDSALGKAKVKVGGSPEGHNGLKSIIDQIGTREFLRLKIGISRPQSHDPSVVAGYVLSNFSPDEAALLQKDSFEKSVLLLKQKGFLA